MKWISLVCFWLGLLISSSVFACFVPRPEQMESIDKLVSRTKNIYLAEAISRNSDGFISFNVHDTLKGKSIKTFQIHAVLIEKSTDTDFDLHKSPDFWRASGGRAEIEPSCQLVATFRKGKMYLIFADIPYHFKSFEQIDSDKDTWLKRVREELKKKSSI